MVMSLLQLKAANGLDIPYVGFLELDVELCDKKITKCGVLVVSDPFGQPSSAPGVLGMNIKTCYGEFFSHHGSALFFICPLCQRPPANSKQPCNSVTRPMLMHRLTAQV